MPTKLSADLISESLRTALSAADLGPLVLATIPTGRDPRLFLESDDFPQAVVHIKSTVTRPVGIGGASEAVHGISIYVVFQYDAADDVNMMKIVYAQQIFDFLCTNKAVGGLYKAFINDGEGRAFPVIDYDPEEERVYHMTGFHCALTRVYFAVRQSPPFNINA